MSLFAGPLLILAYPSCLSVRGPPPSLSPKLTRMLRHASPHWLRGMALLLLLQTATSVAMLPNSTGWEQILDKYLDEEGGWWKAKHRGKRAITDNDAQLILDLHNKLRGQVYPPASNMEHMVSGRRAKRSGTFTLCFFFLQKIFDPILNSLRYLYTGPYSLA